MASQKHALVLVANALPAKVNAGSLLKQAAKGALKHISAIALHEGSAARHALSLGALLWQVKSAKPACGFQEWIEKNVPTHGYRACAYHMKLSMVLAEKAKLTQDEWNALPTLGSKAPKGGHAKAAFQKIGTFVGELSLTELLIKHGVKTVGLKSELMAGDDGSAAPNTDSDGQMFFAEIAEQLDGYRSVVLDRARLVKLDGKQLDALKREIDQTRSEFLKLYEEARGNIAK
jgi:hypothetical protein